MEPCRRIDNELRGESMAFSLGKYQLYTEPPHRVVFDEKNTANGWHVHNLHEICICTRGRGLFRCAGREYPFSQGAVFAGTPGVPHTISLDGEEMELFYFIFQLELQKGPETPESRLAERYLSSRQVLAAPCPRALEYPPLFGVRPTGVPSPAYRHLLLALILECLGLLTQTPDPDTDEQKIMDYITSHIQEPILSRDLARLLSLSERSLYSYFQKRYAMTPASYINQARLSIAKGYLCMGFPVAQAGEKAGFPDPSSFCRIFRRLTGVTPSEYRRNTLSSPKEKD